MYLVGAANVGKSAFVRYSTPKLVVLKQQSLELQESSPPVWLPVRTNGSMAMTEPWQTTDRSLAEVATVYDHGTTA